MHKADTPAPRWKIRREYCQQVAAFLVLAPLLLPGLLLPPPLLLAGAVALVVFLACPVHPSMLLLLLGPLVHSGRLELLGRPLVLLEQPSERDLMLRAAMPQCLHVCVPGQWPVEFCRPKIHAIIVIAL